MIFDVAALTDKGPRSINEDVAAFWKLGSDSLAIAVADGLGGMGGGSDASNIAVDVLRRHLTEQELSEENLLKIAFSAHGAIVEAQLSRPSLGRMATTLTAAVFNGSKLVGVHCGDTRAAIARGTGIIKLTSEHSEGERLFQAGKLSKEEQISYPRNNILESALGIHGDIRIDTFSFDLRDGDRVFLSSDGVHQVVYLREMQDVSMESSSASIFCEKMDAAVKERGARDNYSLVAVFLTDFS